MDLSARPVRCSSERRSITRMICVRLHGSPSPAVFSTVVSTPSSQDKIFGMNFGLEPERDLGWDAGIEQRFWNKRITLGATYFHNDLSNVIGFNGLFETLNLGKARTQGVECELRARPFDEL